MSDPETQDAVFEITDYIREKGVSYAKAANLSASTIKRYESGANDTTNVMQTFARIEYEVTERMLAEATEAANQHNVLLNNVTASHEQEIQALKATHQVTVDAMHARQKELESALEIAEAARDNLARDNSDREITLGKLRAALRDVRDRTTRSIFGLRADIRRIVDSL